MRNAGVLVVVACTGLAVAPSIALAGFPPPPSEVGFTFTANTFVPGFETLTVGWSSDPSAVFTVTPAGPGTAWDISLVGSGHATLGGGGFFWQPGQVITWADPLNAGMYSNLTYINDSTWHLQILSPIADSTVNGGLPAFSNGVSIWAGPDLNGDLVFASVSIVPTPGAAAVLGLGGAAALRRRRR
ncbi:MAG: MYXO-CTERM sorting domain-containing protein [Phycisphaerales bacterium]